MSAFWMGETLQQMTLEQRQHNSTKSLRSEWSSANFKLVVPSMTSSLDLKSFGIKIMAVLVKPEGGELRVSTEQVHLKRTDQAVYLTISISLRNLVTYAPYPTT